MIPAVKDSNDREVYSAVGEMREVMRGELSIIMYWFSTSDDFSKPLEGLLKRRVHMSMDM